MVHYVVAAASSSVPMKMAVREDASADEVEHACPAKDAAETLVLDWSSAAAALGPTSKN